MKRVTEITICDDCGAEGSRTYNVEREADLAMSAGGMNYIGRLADYCGPCTAKRLRARADQIEAQRD